MHTPPPSPDRRRFLAAAGSTLLLPAAASLPAFATGGIPTAATPFALADVHLDAGPFAHSQTLNRRYLAALDIDRLLAPYRIEAGLPSPASKYPNWSRWGWTATPPAITCPPSRSRSRRATRRCDSGSRRWS